MKKVKAMQILKSVFLIATAYSLALGLAACDNKNADPEAPPIVVGQNCLGCGAVTGSMFYHSLSTSYNKNITLNLNFYGNTQLPMYFGSYLGSPVVTYAGPIRAEGSLHVNVMANIVGCIIPKGDYSVQTIQAGQWYNAVANNLRLSLSGPTQIYLTMSSAQVSAKKYTDMGKLWTEIPQEGSLFADFIIESVGGYTCGQKVLLN